jgi:hypothetical protein
MINWRKIMEIIVPIKNSGAFTEAHRATVESLLRKEAFPQFFTNSVFKTLKFNDEVLLIDSNLIERDTIGSSQTPREDGLNEKYDELKQDITEKGFRLYDKPIFVRRTTGGKYILVDGRTKDKILHERKFKNRICVVIEIDGSELEKLSKRLNAGEGVSPAGLLKEVDIIKFAHREIENGNLELDFDVILDMINTVCGTGKFSAKKRTEFAWQIFHQQSAIANSFLAPIRWANGAEVESWMQRTKYIETPTVVYLPYAASSPMKAVFAAAKLSREKPNKKIRVVVYVSKLNGYDLQECYLKAVLKFKDLWFDYMALLGKTYYHDAKISMNNVELYGCVPNNIEDVCDDMEKLIVFGKNDQKINKNYLTGQNLSKFLEVDNEEEFDEELEGV